MNSSLFIVTSLRSVIIVTTQHSLNKFSSAFAAPIIHSSFFYSGPCPIQLVVVIAVRNAVSAATIIFTASSIKFCFFMINHLHLPPQECFRLRL